MYDMKFLTRAHEQLEQCNSVAELKRLIGSTAHSHGKLKHTAQNGGYGLQSQSGANGEKGGEVGMTDRESIIKKCQECIDSGEPSLDYSFYYAIIRLLKEQPEVIRCKDCKHHSEKYLHANGHEYVVCWHDGYGIHKLANGFCNYGERKDNYND